MCLCLGVCVQMVGHHLGFHYKIEIYCLVSLFLLPSNICLLFYNLSFIISIYMQHILNCLIHYNVWGEAGDNSKLYTRFI